MSNEKSMDKQQSDVTEETVVLPESSGQDVQSGDVPSKEAPPVLSPGAQLAARREALGLSPERVAEQLKMTTRQIFAIEADNHASVHSKAIFRGFVRAYAKVLKMDPEALVAMIPDDAAPKVSLSPVRRRVAEPFSETRLPLIGRRNTSTRKILVAIAGLLILIGVLLGQKMGWIPGLPKSITQRFFEKPASASASVAVAKANSVNPAAPVLVDANEKTKLIPLPPVDVSAQLASKPASAPAVVAAPDPAIVATAAPDVAEAASGNVLVIKCREESWIEIKRANGSVLADHKIPAGTTETFRITEPVQLTLGNGPGVEATLRGVALDIPVEANSKVVRLNIK